MWVIYLYTIPNTQQSCVKLCQPWATSFPLGLVYPRWCLENVHLHGIIWCKKKHPKCKKKHHEAKKTKIIGKLSAEFCLATILRCCAKKKKRFSRPYLDTKKVGNLLGHLSGQQGCNFVVLGTLIPIFKQIENLNQQLLVGCMCNILTIVGSQLLSSF